MSEAVPTILDTYESLTHTPNPYESTVVDTPEGVARISPNIMVIRELAREKATEKGIFLPNERFEELRFLQTPEALQASVLPVNEAAVDKLTLSWLYTTALANKFSPEMIGRFFHNVIPVAGSAIYLNTQKSIKQINSRFQNEQDRYPTRESDLYLTALHQNLNFQVEEAVNRWLLLSDPNIKRRVMNIADMFIYQPMATMLATKTLIGSLPISLFLNHTQNASDLLRNMFVVGSIGLSVGMTKKLVKNRNTSKFQKDFEGTDYKKDLLKIDF
jgi:hypothetical protein